MQRILGARQSPPTAGIEAPDWRSAPRRRQWSIRYASRIRVWGGLFVAPALAIFLVFKYIPMA